MTPAAAFAAPAAPAWVRKAAPLRAYTPGRRRGHHSGAVPALHSEAVEQ